MRGAEPPRQRHRPSALLVRGVVATAAGALMASGVYALGSALGAGLFRRRRGEARGRATVASEWALAIAVSATRPLGFLGLTRGTAVGPRPVILVHGYGMGQGYFVPLARRLAQAGLGPLIGFEYFSLGRVASASARLADFVDLVRGATGAERVDLVGHSMGGVVASHYVSLGGGAERVANLITIGSPHGGTEVSVFGIGRPTRELLPDSELCAALGRAGVPPGVAMTTIWSRADTLVWSERQARVAGADELVFDDLGHLGLLASRRVARAVAERLST